MTGRWVRLWPLHADGMLIFGLIGEWDRTYRGSGN